MAPKAAKRSSSVKAKSPAKPSQGWQLDAARKAARSSEAEGDQAAAIPDSPTAFQEEQKEYQGEQEEEEQGEDQGEETTNEDRAARWLQASHTPKPAPRPREPKFDGARPDEEFLEAVRVEAEGQKRQSKLAKESVEKVYAMHRAGEDINQRSLGGYTCLALATAAGNPELVSILLERNADVTLATVDKAELPLHLAAQGGYELVCHMLVGPTKAAGLLDAPTVTGWPALHLAVAAFHFPAMTVLLKAGSSIGVRNNLLGGLTVLHLAARMGSMDVVETLLCREADIASADNQGRNLLHYAAASADSKSVSLLLRSKADVKARDRGNFTAIDLVPREHPGREKTLYLLQAYSRPPPDTVFRTDTHFQTV